MEVVKERWKRKLIAKVWQRWFTWVSRKKGEAKVRNGCFSVYVGAERQKFMVKTEFVNHPLFKMLLDDAEMEYGFGSDGPIWLPCDMELFFKVMAEMDAEEDERTVSGSFSKGYSSFALCSPSRLLLSMNAAHYDQPLCAYKLLDSSLLPQLNYNILC